MNDNRRTPARTRRTRRRADTGRRIPGVNHLVTNRLTLPVAGWLPGFGHPRAQGSGIVAPLDGPPHVPQTLPLTQSADITRNDEPRLSGVCATASIRRDSQRRPTLGKMRDDSWG